MILQALAAYYEDLERAGKISPPGWGPAKISHVLYLSSEGQLEQITCIKAASSHQGRSRGTIQRRFAGVV